MHRFVLIALALAGCVSQEARDELPLYLGYEAKPIDEELVNIFLWMRATAPREDVAGYGDCAAAQYALDTGAGFARHLRTNMTKRGGIWRSDAVYTISVELPPGLKTIEAQTFAQSCAESGIPTT